MIKVFCNHCGKEIKHNEIELDEEDLFWDALVTAFPREAAVLEGGRK